MNIHLLLLDHRHLQVQPHCRLCLRAVCPWKQVTTGTASFQTETLNRLHSMRSTLTTHEASKKIIVELGLTEVNKREVNQQPPKVPYYKENHSRTIDVGFQINKYPVDSAVDFSSWEILEFCNYFLLPSAICWGAPLVPHLISTLSSASDCPKALVYLPTAILSSLHLCHEVYWLRAVPSDCRQVHNLPKASMVIELWTPVFLL